MLRIAVVAATLVALVTPNLARGGETGGLVASSTTGTSVAPAPAPEASPDAQTSKRLSAEGVRRFLARQSQRRSPPPEPGLVTGEVFAGLGALFVYRLASGAVLSATDPELTPSSATGLLLLDATLTSAVVAGAVHLVGDTSTDFDPSFLDGAVGAVVGYVIGLIASVAVVVVDRNNRGPFEQHRDDLSTSALVTIGIAGTLGPLFGAVIGVNAGKDVRPIE
ncbi:MAG: hypothetical protein RIT81_30430 [Deltaproteobacteria bacterium]